MGGLKVQVSRAPKVWRQSLATLLRQTALLTLSTSHCGRTFPEYGHDSAQLLNGAVADELPFTGCATLTQKMADVQEASPFSFHHLLRFLSLLLLLPLFSLHFPNLKSLEDLSHWFS